MSTYQQMKAYDRPIPGTCAACGRYTPDLRFHRCPSEARFPWNRHETYPLDQRDRGDEA